MPGLAYFRRAALISSATAAYRSRRNCHRGGGDAWSRLADEEHRRQPEVWDLLIRVDKHEGERSTKLNNYWRRIRQSMRLSHGFVR